MILCNIYIYPSDLSIQNAKIIHDNNKIIIQKDNEDNFIFNIYEISSYHFEQKSNIYRFYLSISNNQTFKNKILVIESINSYLINFMITNVKFINITNPTLPYWAIFIAKYNIYYNSNLFSIIGFFIALTNILLISYNFIYPHINSINIIKFLENNNIIKYFDVVTNLYIYILFNKFNVITKYIYSNIPLNSIYNLCKYFYDILPITQTLDIIKFIFDLFPISSIYNILSWFYNLIPINKTYNLFKSFYDLMPFSYIYNTFKKIFNYKQQLNIHSITNDNSHNLLKQIFQKIFNFSKFVSSIILSDYYRLKYKKRYLIVSFLIVFILYILYCYLQ